MIFREVFDFGLVKKYYVGYPSLREKLKEKK
jgi:hypothetical protein